MSEPLKLLFVYAHPDDETLGTGPTAAKYAAEGVEVYLVTATHGERGWQGNPAGDPGETALARIRESELLAAARVLGIKEVNFLNYIDGDLDQAPPAEVVEQLVSHMRRIRPDVVVTFAPDGAYGHPDHIAICQFTQAALMCAADSTFGAGAPHRVSKFYYVVDRQELADVLEPLIGTIGMEIDGVLRQQVVWKDWSITTWVDCSPYWRQVVEATFCHHSQLPSLGEFNKIADELQMKIWGTQTFYRVFSLVNGGRRIERDLFEGLRS
jgi:LmbE family N-acetylglucosaminyl deacetylase